MSTLIPKSIINNSNGLKDAPNDGKDYVLKDGNWEDIDSLDLRYVSDAPADGNTYRRRNGAWVPADPKSNISTHLMTDHCIGVEMAYSGGGSGTWVNINKDGKYVRTSPTYFDNHPIWGGMKEELIDDQYMIRIPKFYYKNIEHRQIWISDKKEDDTFKLHPAFYFNGNEVDQVFVGKYEMGFSSSNTALSQPGIFPSAGNSVYNYYTTRYNEYANNRNVNGVTGFENINIYVFAAIQTLFLIEYSTPDSKMALGTGYCTGPATGGGGSIYKEVTDSLKHAIYRGLYALWGNEQCVLEGAYLDAMVLKIWKNDGSRELVKTSAPALVAYSGYNGYSSFHSKMTTVSGDGYDLTDIYFPDGSTPQITNYNDATYGCGYLTYPYYPTYANQRICILGRSSSTHIPYSGLFAYNIQPPSGSGKDTTYYGGGRLIKY